MFEAWLQRINGIPTTGSVGTNFSAVFCDNIEPI